MQFSVFGFLGDRAGHSPVNDYVEELARARDEGFSRARRGRIAAVLAAAALTFGCAAPPAAPATDVPASSADAPAPRPPCARPADQVRQVELDPAIHLSVTILLAGTGNRGVALLPQAGGDVCQLADFGHHLADMGYRVATFGPWSSPNRRPATAAYDALIAAGAERAVVLGASQGATVALANAAALSPAPAGVITLSADGDAVAGAAAYPGPLLLAGTENDMYSPGGVTRRLAELHPGTETLLLFAGADHGIELLDRATEPIEKFLRRTLPT